MQNNVDAIIVALHVAPIGATGFPLRLSKVLQGDAAHSFHSSVDSDLFRRLSYHCSRGILRVQIGACCLMSDISDRSV